MARVKILLSAIVFLFAIGVVSTTIVPEDSYAEFGGDTSTGLSDSLNFASDPIGSFSTLIFSLQATGIIWLDYLIIYPLKSIIWYEILRLAAEGIQSLPFF